LHNWIKSDLFQFYHDTTPLFGDLKTLIPQLTSDDIRNAILTGACNIYHLCGHNIIHEKDPGILKSLYKGAVFAIQALYYCRTGNYIKKHNDLIEKVSQKEQILLKTYQGMKGDQPAKEISFDELSRALFDWAGQIIKEYGKENEN